MNEMFRREHRMDSLFTMILFALYVFLLLVLLLFSGETYRASAQGLSKNNGLYTSLSYITEKVRQHDRQGAIRTEDLQGRQALCLTDTYLDREFATYIYEEDGQLKELFTSAQSQAAPSMGTAVASVEEFRVSDEGNGLLQVYVQDHDGESGTLYLHSKSSTYDEETGGVS